MTALEPKKDRDARLAEMCRIAREVGLDPSQIPADDCWKINGDTIRYKYILFDADGKPCCRNNRVLTSGWLTAKVGGAE